MKIECKDLEGVLREQEPSSLEALARHAESCPGCARELRLWNEISAAAGHMRKSWDSPGLWPRIQQALVAQSQAAAREPRIWSLRWLWGGFARNWQVAAAAFALLVITASGAWMLLRNPGPAVEPDTAKRLLNKQAVREVEAAEAAYIKSIEKLSALAGPRIEHPATPLMVSYREKLLLLDAAIAECRANIEQNRWNAHLRQELLEIYQQKQRTLQDVVREE